jgi:IS4 transposase
VELFFKWIKQHLRIKHFYGTSDNAVKTQIWISICVYVLLAIVKKRLKSEKSLYSILQILSVNAFEQEPLHQILMDSGPQILEGSHCNQLVFNY